MADVNRYRFSSKEVHPTSGLYYYGYRFYEPNLQRWLNEDPIGEAGGLNLFGFVGNNPINRDDPEGLDHHQNQCPIGLSGTKGGPITGVQHNFATFQPDPQAVFQVLHLGAAAGEAIGATALLAAPEPLVSKGGSALLYGKAADDLTAAFTGKGLMQRGLEGVYGADNPSIGTSINIYNWFTAPLAVGANLPTSIQNATLADLANAIKNAKPPCPPANAGLNLPSELRSQIESVVKSLDETGKPPPGVWQGGRKGSPQGRFLNDKGKLPVQPPGYYTASDIWPGSPGNRVLGRIVVGRGGEVYYTTHYESFIRIR